MRVGFRVLAAMSTAALLLLVAAGGDRAYGQRKQTGPGTIKGEVFACPGNDRVLVYIPGRSFVAVTGDDGTFLLENVPPATYTVLFDKGQNTIETSATVSAGSTTTIPKVSFTNTSTDAQNCGACGNPCPSGSCVDGACVPPPPPLKSNGSACSAASECQSSYCVDGVCCNTACTGACQSCNNAIAMGSCNLDGASVLCRPASCSNGVMTIATYCSGISAACPGMTTQSCGAYACATTACYTSCSTSAQCSAGYACVNSVCTAQ